MPTAIAEPPKKHYLGDMDMMPAEAELLGSPVLSRVYREVVEPKACIFHECKSECKKDCTFECKYDSPCSHKAW